MAFLTTALAKNLLVLFALLLGCILLFLYLALFPTTSTPATPIDPLNLATFTYNRTAGPNNATVNTTIPQLPDSVLSHTYLYRADKASSSSNWTYSHYPALYIVNGTSPLLLAAWSNALQDEDSDGERVLYTTISIGTVVNSTNTTTTAAPPTILFASALRSGEPPAPTYNASQLVRAMSPAAFVQVSDGTLYAVAELYGRSDVTGMPREGSGLKGTGYGRVAQQLSTVDGSKVGDVCWVEWSKYAQTALSRTPYWLQTPPPLCIDAAELITLLADPTMQPPSSWSLLSDNHAVVAADGSGQLGEPTHAVQTANNETCRFWRSFDQTAPLNHTLYIECTNTSTTAAGWFNGTGDFMHRGVYNYTSITATNLPDANSRAFLGAFPETSGNARSTYLSFKSAVNLTHYLVSNPVPTTYGLLATRSPLTVATSIDSGRTFNAIAALRSAPTVPRYYSPLKNAGYQYPAAAVRSVGWLNGTSLDVLYVVYSVNKEDIVLTSVPVTALPRNVTTAADAAAGGDAFGKGYVFFILCLAAVVLIGAATYWVLQRGRVEERVEEAKWQEKRVPLVNGKHIEVVEEEYEEEEEYEDGDEEEEEDEDEQVEEHKHPADNGYVTSADVARLVTSQPTTNKARRPVQLA